MEKENHLKLYVGHHLAEQFNSEAASKKESEIIENVSKQTGVDICSIYLEYNPFLKENEYEFYINQSIYLKKEVESWDEIFDLVEKRIAENINKIRLFTVVED